MAGRVVVLCGGVGGAKLVLGLSQVLPPEKLLVVVNTGDDFEHFGLTICPDLDTVTYTLADLADRQRGWGRADETWHFMDTIRALGGEDWFNLGDHDLALHAERTRRLKAGQRLSQVTADLLHKLRVTVPVVPMSDDPVRTVVDTDEGPLPFQHYFVRRRCEPKVSGFRFDGAQRARPHAVFVSAIAEAEAIVIAPSNPYVSVDPILALAGVRDAIAATRAPVVAVSPIVGGKALKGPAAKMMDELGVPASAEAVAEHYRGLVDVMVVDWKDAGAHDAIAQQGMRALTVNTVMTTLDERIALARDVLDIAVTVDTRERA